MHPTTCAGPAASCAASSTWTRLRAWSSVVRADSTCWSALLAADWALAIPAPTHVEPHVGRVTLNPAIVTAAREVVVVAHGLAKAGIVGTVLDGEPDVRRLPAQLTRRAGATWIIDKAAAANLPQHP